jgi:hypothetical protein
MGTVTTTITADKEGFIAHLEEHRAAHLRNAELVGTQKKAARERGVAEGLALAIHLIQNWEIV